MDIYKKYYCTNRVSVQVDLFTIITLQYRVYFQT